MKKNLLQLGLLNYRMKALAKPVICSYSVVILGWLMPIWTHLTFPVMW